MIFKRKIYNKIKDWKKNSAGASALLIEGARRIGKSTICEEFAKNEYKSYIKIDFSLVDDNIKSYFYENLGQLDDFFMLISSYYGIPLYERNTLFIFDEIQKFPRAREAIKYLVADGRYDYIETGSLISIRENVKDIVIPSEERKIKMYPMDFEEFLIALNENILLDYIKNALTKKSHWIIYFIKKQCFYLSNIC